jgi:hypothetical protein
MSKYGVVIAFTTNLGDDIQTLAAIELLRKKNINEYVFVDRENLNSYNGPNIKVIMNGWYMHNINNFPPSNRITPIFISFHCNDENIIKNNVQYFKNYEPIGCRDQYTVDLFKKYDVENMSHIINSNFNDINYRLNEASKLLNKYRNAELVITSSV